MWSSYPEVADLQAKRIKEENIIKDLENSKTEIRKLAEEKVRILLSNRRRLMKLAALCIIENSHTPSLKLLNE